jgi:hypothetical protein
MRPATHLIRQQHIVNAPVHHGFGFAQLLAAHPDRPASRALQLRNLNTLVRLGVRPYRHPPWLRQRRQKLLNVVLERRRIHNQRWRVNVPQ